MSLILHYSTHNHTKINDIVHIELNNICFLSFIFYLMQWLSPATLRYWVGSST